MKVDREQAAGSGIRAALSFLRSNPLYLFSLLTLLLALRFLKNRYASPLRHYPGPFLASGTRLWKLGVTWTTHQETAFINLHKKYGSLAPSSPTPISRSHSLLTEKRTQAQSSASPPTNSPSPARPPRAKSSAPARASTKRPSTPSSRRPTTGTSSPRRARRCTRRRSAWPGRRTACRACRRTRRAGWRRRLRCCGGGWMGLLLLLGGRWIWAAGCTSSPLTSWARWRLVSVGVFCTRGGMLRGASGRSMRVSGIMGWWGSCRRWMGGCAGAGRGGLGRGFGRGRCRW